MANPQIATKALVERLREAVDDPSCRNKLSVPTRHWNIVRAERAGATRTLTRAERATLALDTRAERASG